MKPEHMEGLAAERERWAADARDRAAEMRARGDKTGAIFLEDRARELDEIAASWRQRAAVARGTP